MPTREEIMGESNTTDEAMEPCKDCDAQLYSTNICYFRTITNRCIHPELVISVEPLVEK